jgi:hypothetical protein
MEEGILTEELEKTSLRRKGNRNQNGKQLVFGKHFRSILDHETGLNLVFRGNEM